jgi:hypothetical protein
MDETRPVCCGRKMIINNRRGRHSGGISIQYRCTVCGKVMTIREKEVKDHAR